MTARPRLTPLLLGVLGFTGAVSPLASDMYLASFGNIQQDLGTTASMVQLTLAVFFLGNAVGQLLLGPLSDTLGRRPLLVGSLSVYAALSIALVFTPSIEVFIWLRLMLGFTGAAGIVLARAIAADLSEGITAVKALSVIAMVGGLGPLLAPPIGGLTQEFWGWRGTLATLAAASVLMLVLAWVYVPESLPVSERRPANLRANFAAFGSLIAAPKYLWFMLAFVAGFSAMIAYISASPFVGQNVLSMSPLMYSLGFATSGTALVLSNILNARIAERVGPPRMLGYGTLIMLLGAVGMLVLSLTGTLQIWSFITCAFLLTGGAGITMSNASALALTAATHARGFGAALLGSTQFAFGGLIAPFVGAWGESTAVPMGVIACSAAAIAALFALLGARSLRVIE
jgi:DHA1 family bicyclomycin/chloramphenicol resistance-like MFS transporter